MRSEYWDRLESLFLEAIALPPTERAGFLEAECGDDVAMRDELGAMMQGHGAGTSAPDWLLRPVAVTPTEALGVGSRLGPWQLEQLIGQGGMGSVYRAARVDMQFDQQVAIKLVRPERSSPLLLQRFLQERRIMAKLVHPGIASLLDGGLSPGGQPYLVMQYVDGIPITRYAAERQLTLRQRLHLFTAVCDAVQFAHGHLVVHRDIKPSNILVGEDGVPRLLDFGIAKLIGPADADSTTGELLLLTPEHAAPEQFLGDPVTTATDVYALGVLLYELVCGRRPFEHLPPAEIGRAVCEQAPQPPSTVRAVDRDVDHIVMMALRKEPSRRYATPEQMRQDVTRFLGGWPVVARSDTAGYRLRRFVGRNRTVVALGALTVVALTTSSIVTARESSRRAAALAVAEAQRARANGVTDFLLGVFRASNPGETRGKTITARELLDQAALRVRSDLATEPAARADMAFAIAKALAFVGQLNAADTMLTEVVEARRRMVPNEPIETAMALDWHARVRMTLGELPDGIALMQEATAIRGSVLGEENPELAPALYRIGAAQLQLDPVDTTGQARRALERAIALFIRADSADSRGLADAQRQLATLLLDQDKTTEALDMYREALASARRGTDDDDPYVFSVKESLAIGLAVNGYVDSAITIHQDLLEARRKVFGEEHMDVSFSLFNLAKELSRAGRHAESYPWFQRCIAMREKLLGPAHFQVGFAVAEYGRSRALSGDTASALPLFTRAVDIFDAAFGPAHYDTMNYMETLAFLHIALGHTDRAVRILEKLVANGYRGLESPNFAPLRTDPRFVALLRR